MSGADCLTRLIATLRHLQREEARTFDAGYKSADLCAGRSDKRRQRLVATANECAIEVRRLRHEAHCLAVEAGLADLRDDSHYTPTTAPLGFGREVRIERRRPNI